MLLVRVGRHEKGVAAFRPAHSQFIADTVCLLRCDFTGIESHSYLVKEHVRFLFLPPPTYRSLIAAFASRNSSVTVAESHS